MIPFSSFLSSPPYLSTCHYEGFKQWILLAIYCISVVSCFESPTEDWFVCVCNFFFPERLSPKALVFCFFFFLFATNTKIALKELKDKAIIAKFLSNCDMISRSPEGNNEWHKYHRLLCAQDTISGVGMDMKWSHEGAPWWWINSSYSDCGGGYRNPHRWQSGAELDTQHTQTEMSTSESW